MINDATRILNITSVGPLKVRALSRPPPTSRREDLRRQIDGRTVHKREPVQGTTVQLVPYAVWDTNVVTYYKT